MASRRKPITAAELMTRLNADPEFVAMRTRRDAASAQKAAAMRAAESPLLTDLRSAGFELDSIWDLVHTSAPYPEALPILAQHLSRPYPGPVRDAIARALAVPEAKFAWRTLTRLYAVEQDATAKSGLAAAIAVVADEETFEELVALARDTRQGSSRILLLTGLERFESPRARAVLMGLGTDPELEKEVQAIFARQLKRKRRRKPRR